jgi:hypothetical protein
VDANAAKHAYGFEHAAANFDAAVMEKEIGPTLSVDSRKAYLFQRAGTDWLGVTLEPGGGLLPRDKGPWTMKQAFWLGVHEALPFEADPEPILRGIMANGYFAWRQGHTYPFGTTQ